MTGANRPETQNRLPAAYEAGADVARHAQANRAR